MNTDKPEQAADQGATERGRGDPTAAETLEGTLMLVGDTIAQAASRVHEFHRAIADIPFKAVGTATISASKPVEMVHNEITDLVYGAVRETGKGLFSGAAWVVRQANQSLSSPQIIDEALGGELMEQVARVPVPGIPGDTTGKRVAAISSAINGVFGDHLAATRNPMEVKMGLYAHGQLVGTTQEELMQQFPQATRHLVVFVHGLCCNEDSWNLYMDPARPETRPYAVRLEEDFALTALHLRYNTGRTIEANARQFKRLLNKLVRNWPVAVDGVTLVGHSMGGLVSRALVEMIDHDDLILRRAIRDVVCLGSPHDGAPLARLAAAGEQLFNRFELSKPLGRVLGVRSRGIRDLKDGLGPLKTHDGHDVMFHLIGSSIGDSTGSWLPNTVGDGLVTVKSALADDTGRAQRLAFSHKHHMNLLNDPEVYLELQMVMRQHLRQRVE
ncbi:GPI inositol-deacylase [Limnobacter humi]|uniref:GPI inositol-deacylase n=1 Tax=Limnobacter humi TaxID=1778671 RepID=A0ABT1WF57_9BURK|nr:alpha/beta fold hydrolase [Limnobacter humi]MCQ8895686.1 GPI inositol-deacylase [Limnobacter humi]